MRRDHFRDGGALVCTPTDSLIRIAPHRVGRKRLHLIICTILLLVANAVRADVVIYQAAYTYKSDADSLGNAPKKGTSFFLFDFDTQLSSLILLDPVKKRIIVGNPPSKDFQYATPNLLGGKTATVITGDGSLDSTDPTNFNNSFFYFRGENKSLRVRTQPTTQFVTAPRTLNGTLLEGGVFDGRSHFVELRFFLVFQAARTLAANNAAKTVQEATDNLLAELRAKGFTGP